MNQNGKSLMEVMVVLALVGIVAGMAIPNLSGLQSRSKSTCALEEIASELRLARQLAITHRERVQVVFDLDQRTLSVHFVTSGTIHHSYYYGDKDVVIDEPSAGPDIFFHPSGRTATATTIQLHTPDGETRTMTVGLTGRVSHS